MRLASLALAALFLVPAASAQVTTALMPGDAPASVAVPFADRLSANTEITQNSSLDIESGTVACAATDPEGGALGSTTNSFWRVIDLSEYTLPPDASLTGANFGVSISLFEAETVQGQFKVHTLPAGTNVSSGFSTANLTEIASADLEYGSIDVRSLRELVSASFDAPPALVGDELIAVELTFPDGTPPEEGERQYDARAGGNEAAADGVSYLSTPDCGGIGPTPMQSLGATFTTEFVVVLLVGTPGGTVTIGSARDAGVGAEVFVRGVVSRAEGAYTYLQDETGGLALRQTSGQVFDAVQNGVLRPGAEVEVTGTLSEFNGLLQINGSALTSYTYLGQGEAPAAQVVTFAEITANGEDYESELVEVDAVSFDALDASGTFEASTNYDATDASGPGVVRIQTANDTEIDGTTLIAEPAIVTGVLVQNSSTDPAAGYRVAPIDLGDVRNAAVAVGESPDGRLGLGAAVPNPSARTATIVVSMATAGPATLAVYDVLGREVARVLDGPLAAGTTPVGIDVSGLPAGTYLVRLSAGGAVAVRPLTVVR